MGTRAGCQPEWNIIAPTVELLFIGHVWSHYRAVLRQRLGDRHRLAFFGTVSELVVAVPLNEETRGMVNGPRLERMKEQAFLVAISRGPVVDEEALYTALEQRRIAGAAIDVWYEYPRSPGQATRPSAFPFEGLDNVIMTPHSSGMTEATFDRRIDDIVDNIERLERGEPLGHVVAVGEQRHP